MITAPKTESSVRVITIHKELQDESREYISTLAFCIHKFLMPVLKIFGADTLPIFLLRIASVAMIIIASSIVVGLQFIRLPFMGREIDG